MIVTYVFAAVFSLLGVGIAAWYTGGAARTRAAHQLARKVDLALDPPMEAAVAARLGRRLQVGALAGAVGVWVTLAVLAPVGATSPAGYGPLFVVAGYFVGHAAGFWLVAWYETHRPVPPGPRLARASSPTHDDYVARYERWGAWGAAVFATLLALAVLVADRTGALDLGVVPWGLVVATATLPWVAIVADEVVARRLLDRRQVAGSQLELAWDDALRAQTLRDMVLVPIVAGVYLPIALLGRLGEAAEGGWPANPVVGLTSGLVLAIFVAGFVLAMISVARGPERHFRTRLWGEAAEAGALR